MKVSVAFAAVVASCLSGGVINYAWSGDLEAALENISIRSDEGNVPKKVENNELLCAVKGTDVQCANPQEDPNETATNAASAIPDSLLNGNIPNVTVNGAAVDTVNYKSAIVAGGF